MPIRLPSSVLISAVLLSLLTRTALRDCLAQIPSKAADAAARSATSVKEPPFDKLELFGFLAAAPNDAYANRVVQERGTSFTPDATFTASFPSPGFQAILRSLKPQTSKTLSPDRERAYELLHKAWNAKQNRQWAAAGESFQQALQLAPSSATLHLAYAASLLVPQNYREAEAQARQSLKLWPENAVAHATLALSLTAQKHFGEAEAESREALRIALGKRLHQQSLRFHLCVPPRRMRGSFVLKIIRLQAQRFRKLRVSIVWATFQSKCHAEVVMTLGVLRHRFHVQT